MSESDIHELAAAWIRYYDTEERRSESDPNFWSFDRLADWCSTSPDVAWGAVRAIYEATPNENVLANLAAGPVEDLLVYHGAQTLPWIAAYLDRNPRFVEVLQMVWQNSMEQAVWDELKRLIKRLV